MASIARVVPYDNICLSVVYHWPEPVKRAIVNGDTVAAGVEILKAGMGFRLVPTERDKRPIPWLSHRGVNDATDDPQTWRQYLALAPDAGLGIVPGERFAVIDDDSGSLNADTYGVTGTYAERTRRGTHHWVRIPDGRRARKSKIPEGDFITGRRSYVISSPTKPYAPIDLDAPILTLPEDSPLLARHHDAAPAIEIPILTAADHRKACRVIANLQTGTRPPDGGGCPRPAGGRHVAPQIAK
jgi:hypothetical protein